MAHPPWLTCSPLPHAIPVAGGPLRLGVGWGCVEETYRIPGATPALGHKNILEIPRLALALPSRRRPGLGLMAMIALIL